MPAVVGGTFGGVSVVEELGGCGVWAKGHGAAVADGLADLGDGLRSVVSVSPK